MRLLETGVGGCDVQCSVVLSCVCLASLYLFFRSFLFIILFLFMRWSYVLFFFDKLFACNLFFCFPSLFVVRLTWLWFLISSCFL